MEDVEMSCLFNSCFDICFKTTHYSFHFHLSTADLQPVCFWVIFTYVIRKAKDAAHNVVKNKYMKSNINEPCGETGPSTCLKILTANKKPTYVKLIIHRKLQLNLKDKIINNIRVTPWPPKINRSNICLHSPRQLIEHLYSYMIMYVAFVNRIIYNFKCHGLVMLSLQRPCLIMHHLF